MTSPLVSGGAVTSSSAVYFLTLGTENIARAWQTGWGDIERRLRSAVVRGRHGRSGHTLGSGCAGSAGAMPCPRRSRRSAIYSASSSWCIYTSQCYSCRLARAEGWGDAGRLQTGGVTKVLVARHTSSSCRADKRRRCCPAPDCAPQHPRASESLKKISRGGLLLLEESWRRGGDAGGAGDGCPRPAWLCAALGGGCKKLVGSSSFPTCHQKEPFGGPGPPQGCVLVSRGVEDTRVPQDGTRLKLSSGARGTRTGILTAMLYTPPPNLVVLKLELRKLLISLFCKRFIDPACLLRAGIHPLPASPAAQRECYLWYPIQQTPIFSRVFLEGVSVPCFPLGILLFAECLELLVALQPAQGDAWTGGRARGRSRPAWTADVPLRWQQRPKQTQHLPPENRFPRSYGCRCVILLLDLPASQEKLRFIDQTVSSSSQGC